jgi:penicillin-binding protein activator
VHFLSKIRPVVTLIAASLLLQACVTTGNMITESDSSESSHLQADMNTRDLLALAEKLTNQMMMDDKLQHWPEKKPRFMVSSVLNDTDDPTLVITEMTDRIQEIIFNAEIARIVDRSANKFDYFIKSTVSSQREFGNNGKEDVTYTVKFRLLNFDGELVGSWSENMRLTKGARPIF